MTKKFLTTLIAVIMVVSTMSFTSFAEDATLPEPDVTVGEGKTYTTWSDAITNASDVNGDGVITYGVYGQVAVNNRAIKGSAETVNIIGMDATAELLVETANPGDNGLVYVTDNTIEYLNFYNIILNRPDGAWRGNEAHANMHFTVWDSDGTTDLIKYTNCTFPNGACTNQYGDTTYIDCDFVCGPQNALWICQSTAHASETVVSGCTFEGAKGLKVYSEGVTAAGAKDDKVTISDSEFNITDKPAIVASGAGDVTITNIDTEDCPYGVLEIGNTISVKSTVTIDGETPTYVATCLNKHGETVYVTNEEYAGIVNTEAIANGKTSEISVPVAMVSGENGSIFCESLQTAIDAASADDTILIYAGTYPAFSITDDKDGLTIKAADENNKPVISINNVNDGGIQYHASDLTFENLVFNIEETCADATTWNVSALGYYYEIVKDRNGLTITNCDFINNSDIEMSAIAANISEYTITGCSFKNFATGVHSFMDGGVLDNVEITNNTYENVEKLVNVYYGGQADGTSSLTVSGNTSISGTTEIIIDDYARINNIATTAFNTLTVTNNDATVVLHNYTTDITPSVENNTANVYTYRTEDVLNALAGSAPNGLVYVAYDDEENEKKYVIRNGVAEVYVPKSPSNRPITNKLPTTTGSVTDKTDKPEQPSDISKTQIILTIGKTEASVFGELRANDVAPKLVNDRTMLPARFVAESLGATVTWTEAEPDKVLITKDDIEIIIYIGSDKAYVNGEEVTLDSPAFLENDRTYTPIRFISEELGADVKWNDELQQVIITKK